MSVDKLSTLMRAGSLEGNKMKCKCGSNAVIITHQKTPDGMNKDYAKAQCLACGKSTGWSKTNDRDSLTTWFDNLQSEILK